MAVKGYFDNFVNALPENIRYPIKQPFAYLSDNWRLGADNRGQNAQWYEVTSTTATVANTEFSVLHGLAAAPKWVIPVIDLEQVGSQLVPLVISRAPDSKRVYFK